MPANLILTKMLDRLYASLLSGPGLNCRPHSSRQRVDMVLLERFHDIEPRRALLDLLGERRRCEVSAEVQVPPDYVQAFGGRTADPVGKDDPKVVAWRRQKSLLTKMRNLSEDARTYEQDTGVHALSLGYPILSLPPGAGTGGTRRVVAPIAFVPVDLRVSTGRRAGIELSCRTGGVDLVTPNAALMAALERETRMPIPDAFADETGEDPWREIRELIETVIHLLEMDNVFAAALADPSTLTLSATPRADELPAAPTILPAAVVGLFPATNQGLLRDTQKMIEAKELAGPVRSFIDVSVSLDATETPQEATAETPVPRERRRFGEERFIALADPFQSRTVAHARSSSGLVIHGPPGTGKSQTITNIIGDHLARGQRVLFVCDKRTALDVVFNRLDHIGLGGLCALVHDPRRDQRDLYMGIRGRLEQMPDVKTKSTAGRRLEKLDQDLAEVDDELTRACDALMSADGEDEPFHELIGGWLEIDAPPIDQRHEAALRELTPERLEQQNRELTVVFERGRSVDYAANPWTACLGSSLDAFLARPMDELRRALTSCVEDARAADATIDEHIPPFDPARALDAQARARTELADRLDWIGGHVGRPIAARCSAMKAQDVTRFSRAIADARAHRDALAAGPLDAELKLTLGERLPPLRHLGRDIGHLQRYDRAGRRWYAFLLFGLKRAAGRLLEPYGLPRTPDDARRLATFLTGVRARLILTDLYGELTGSKSNSPVTDDAVLTAELEQYDAALAARKAADAVPALTEPMKAALIGAEARACLLSGLRKSEARAEALGRLEASIANLDLFDPAWLPGAAATTRGGQAAAPALGALDEKFDTVEPLLRVRDAIAKLPPQLRDATEALLNDGTEPRPALDALRKQVLAGAVARRLASAADLRQLDDQKLHEAIDRYRKLIDKKRDLVRDSILHEWISRQKQRLLAGTGTRLSGEGADLRRRLFVRGKRAMRLRQVVAIGRDIEGGDPIFDVCPVWLTSPETVAQVFPRQPMFDTVIFDEASQCRLEEALPVLTRARRVVIAGDPRQLPPTRFFEASIASSDDGGELLESDQDLFEAQQGEVEDLLGAALNLTVEESYLNVHYRSRNADLIGFSNTQFYNERLQAIPGHPARRSNTEPVELIPVRGVYDDRCNPIEAARVADLVQELLDRADPPSIGVACFNLKQRDLIADTLDERAVEDERFARKLADARQRTGEGSFEGLFVKNLENVQGDERDHIIISTTYGPDPNGRFYKRFGPLGRSGGGRRLNVLVTRSREKVHLVSSIPREAYAHADALPEGTTPTGGWLLFAYLRYAEALGAQYRQEGEQRRQVEAAADATVTERRIEPVSRFALALGRRIADRQKISADAHWGNTGFCVDAAVHHPRRPGEVTAGLLCDFARFRGTADPVEWEVYRTGILEWQGWTLHRLWTPNFFRDPQRAFNEITRAAGGK